MKKKELLFTINKNEFRVDFFKGSGSGGQKRNKTCSACRITHMDSGAVGQSTELRSQNQNKRRALERLVKGEKFKKWLKIKCAVKEQGYRDLEHKIDEMMKPENLLIEMGKGANK